MTPRRLASAGELPEGLTRERRCELAAHGTPAIQNSDQGSVFSSEAYVSLLRSHGIHQPMDGRRR